MISFVRLSQEIFLLISAKTFAKSIVHNGVTMIMKNFEELFPSLAYIIFYGKKQKKAYIQKVKIRRKKIAAARKIDVRRTNSATKRTKI